MKNIVETAIEAGTFKTLVEAVKTADLVKTLSGKGPFTVFAPNDAAFAKLPSGTIERLLKNKEKLTSVLTYHVVPRKVMATDVMKLRRAKTVQGQEISIDTTEGVKISGAKVIKTDIECTNGVIHVIDRVIMPK
ncbi:MAG: fasciclin domain-containing protein [Candidatus Bathyarchaeota archaeon]|nr:fasciclin domain-containing protein [Candidatus Bathyarchaeota archaeon]